jgi:hypothetical protein
MASRLATALAALAGLSGLVNAQDDFLPVEQSWAALWTFTTNISRTGPFHIRLDHNTRGAIYVTDAGSHTVTYFRVNETQTTNQGGWQTYRMLETYRVAGNWGEKGYAGESAGNVATID